MTHNPLPWRVEQHSEGYWIKDANGHVVADTSMTSTDAADKANADLIVSAVNNNARIQ